MNTIIIDANQYPESAAYAKLHNISFKQLVEGLLTKFQATTTTDKAAGLQLPPHLEKLGGCLAGVEDSEDERLNYLMEKYK